MKSLLTFAACHVMALVAMAGDDSKTAPRYRSEIVVNKNRDEIVGHVNKEVLIARQEVVNASADEAVEWLRISSIKGKPAGWGINMVVKIGTTSLPKVSLKLDHPTPYFEVLDKICRQAGLLWKIDETGLLVISPG